MNNILVNRRPVVDNNITVHAYEADAIASRGGTPLSTLCEHLDNIAGNNAVLMKLPYATLSAKGHQAFPKERLIFRLQDCGWGEEVSRTLARVSAEGYRLALPESTKDL